MRRCSVGGFSLVLVLALACAAQAEGWQWPNLNPFSSGTKKSTTQKVNNSSGSWLPGWGKSTSTPRSGPTTWQKIQAAPGNAWNKTKQTLSPLNPFKSQPKKTSLNTGFKKKSDEVSGFWPTWMTVEEKQEMEPITVSDWLNQKKPGDE